ncbi:MAG: hypothetical protein LQ343_005370 [Gyalolechia ehrenbergii]|nr:MAG: hypothetical protein LQ343_005370 [Gyalolechia ehrenbergii]
MDDPLPSEAAGMKEGAETRPASSTVSGESSLFIEDSQAGELGKEKSSMAVFSPQEASETQREDPESPDSETPSGRRAPRAAVSKANRMNYDMKHHPADEEIRPAAAKKARARYHDLLARDKGEGGMDKQVTKRI